MRTTTKPSAFYGLRYVYIAVNILIPPQHYRSCLLSCSQCSYLNVQNIGQKAKRIVHRHGCIRQGQDL